MKDSDIKSGDYVEHKETGTTLLVDYYDDWDGIWIGTDEKYEDWSFEAGDVKPIKNLDKTPDGII